VICVYAVPTARYRWVFMVGCANAHVIIMLNITFIIGPEVEQNDLNSSQQAQCKQTAK